MSIIDESEFQHIFKIQFGDKPSEETFCGLIGSSLPQRDDQPFCPRCTLWVVDLMGAGVRHAIDAKADTAQAVAIEREAILALLSDPPYYTGSSGQRWVELSHLEGLMEAIRSGEHNQDQS